MGVPAGLERTMIADLTGKLQPGTRRIRIVSNLKIYWDAIRIDQTPEPRNVRVSEVPLAKAALDFLGYPREIRLQPASDTTYSYTYRSRTGPYARAAGNYTRYGEVRDLLRAPDDRFVVFGSGEGVKLDFDPKALPALSAGWVRDYFFYAAHAFTVEPLPRHSSLPYPYRREGLPERRAALEVSTGAQHAHTLRPHAAEPALSVLRFAALKECLQSHSTGTQARSWALLAMASQRTSSWFPLAKVGKCGRAAKSPVST